MAGFSFFLQNAADRSILLLLSGTFN